MGMVLDNAPSVFDMDKSVDMGSGVYIGVIVGAAGDRLISL